MLMGLLVALSAATAIVEPPVSAPQAAAGARSVFAIWQCVMVQLLPAPKVANALRYVHARQVLHSSSAADKPGDGQAKHQT